MGLGKILKETNKLLIYITTEEDIKTSQNFMRYTHHNDAIHAAICYNMDIPIVTRNIKDFKELPIRIIHSSRL